MEELVTEYAAETGNMLIMMYAHAKFSGDGTLLVQHVRLSSALFLEARGR